MSGGSGGGGQATAVPAWMWESYYVDKDLNELPGQAFTLISTGFDTDPTESIERGGGIDLSTTLKNALSGSTPYQVVDSDTKKTAYDPDPANDALEGETERSRLLPENYRRFKTFWDKVRNVIQNYQGTSFAGPGVVGDKLLTDAETSVLGLGSFDSALYSISSLAVDIAAAAVTRATEEITSGASNVTTNIATLLREAEARTVAGLDMDDGTAKAVERIPYASSISRIEASTAVASGVDSTDAENDSAAPLSTAQTAAKTFTEDEFETALSIITNSVTGLQSVIDAALSAAENALNSTLVNDAVETFDQSGLPEHLMRMNRFAGQMVDINAVNGSAFILGEALLERGHQVSVDEFRSRLSLELYTRAFDAYVDTFKNSLALYLNQLTDRIRDRLSTYQLLLTERARTYLTSYLAHLDSYGRLVGNFLGAEQSSLAHQTQMVGEIFGQHAAYSREFAQTHVREAVNARLNRLGARDDFMRSYTTNLTSLLLFGLEEEYKTAEAITDVQVKRYIAINEQQDREIALRSGHKLWRLDTLGKALNYLAAPSGVYTPPQKPTVGQSMLAGAGMGAKVGGIPGAIVGGFLGALTN